MDALFQEVDIFGFKTPLYTAIAAALVVVLSILLATDKDEGGKKKDPRPKSLNSEEWQPYTLVKVEDISHDVKKFRFSLQSPNHKLGLPIGQHITFKYTDTDGKEVQRSYTPTSSDDETGYVEFVIKVYYKNVHPKFPDGKYLRVFGKSFSIYIEWSFCRW
jgi:hypothetical protein